MTIEQKAHMSFLKKGNKNRLGKRHSEETKQKIRLSLLGNTQSAETNKKRSESLKGKNTWSKGCKLSEEHKAKVSKSLVGNKRCKGYKHTLETRKKMSVSRKGELSPHWQGGITAENMKGRRTFEYKLWRETVMIRDNWTCQKCGIRGGNLEVDHIKSYARYPEFRTSIENGRTLCIPCHRKTDTYGSKSKRR